MEISIKDALLEIADTVTSIQSKFYGSDFEANIQADDSVFPMMHIQRIVSSGVSVNTAGVYKKNWIIFVFFAKQTEMDASADENEIIRTEMEELAVEYLAAINNAKIFELIPSASFQSVYYKFDVNAVGVLKTFTAREKVGHVYC